MWSLLCVPIYTRWLGTSTASQHNIFDSVKLSHFFLRSWRRRGSNLQSLDLESDALPTEPPRQGSTPRFGSPFPSKIVVYVHWLVTLPCAINETFKMAQIAAHLNADKILVETVYRFVIISSLPSYLLRFRSTSLGRTWHRTINWFNANCVLPLLEVCRLENQKRIYY